MRRAERARSVLRSTGLLSIARRVRRRLGIASGGRTPRPVLRVDPVPPLQPFPEARYIFIVGAIPRRYAGRTASVLTKTKLLGAQGVPCEILTMNYSAELDDITAEIRARGALGENVRIINLYDAVAGEHSDPGGEPVSHPIDEPGMSWLKDDDAPVYRYFEDGVYRLYKRFDYAGRLIVRDRFNENRGRTQRDEFDHQGRIRRTTYFDLHFNKPRQEVYFRPDGTAYMNKWLVVDPEDLTVEVERITLFDEQERPTGVLHSHVELIRSYLDRIVGQDRVFLSVESRRTDPETLGYHRPNVKQLYVLHNPHINPPFTKLHRIRETYAPLLNQHAEVDATIFLTNSQRADAEAVFGRQDSFHVIPHPIHPPEPDTTTVRDPNLVVMLARLDQQKQVDHAITAFREVVKHRPQARLEIYGRGPDESQLRSLISRYNLERSVKLKGYTTNPSAVYRRAALSLLTSGYEGFGLVVAESLAHGCPVVSYDLKYGPADIIDDRVDGILVPPDDVSGLARRVVELLSDDQARAAMSEAALRAAERFSGDAFVARWSAVFNDLDAKGWG